MKIKAVKYVAFILVIFLSFTSYGQKDLQERSYVKIEIKGMACPFCAGGMGKAFEKIPGVEKVDMDFDNGLAFLKVSNTNLPTKEILKAIVKDAGFEVGKISFSDKPFEKPKKKTKSKNNN